MRETGDQRNVRSGTARRIAFAAVTLALLGVFVIWRVDGPRVERFRADSVDLVVQRLDWALAPLVGASDFFRDFRELRQLAEENRELRRELLRMQAWKTAAQRLERQNAQLLDLNSVRVDPQMTYVTGVVLADSGSPFRQSVLLNLGKEDGVRDGWAVMDGVGLVGRISGTGATSSRTILLTDAASAVPATILPSGQRAIVRGDYSHAPMLEFVESPGLVSPGDRIVSSGDGRVFPSGLDIGVVGLDTRGSLRVRLAADFERMEYLRVLRHDRPQSVTDTGGLVGPLGDWLGGGASGISGTAGPSREGQ